MTKIAWAALALTLLLRSAGATELGGSSYPVGVELGYGDMLPPGFYNLGYYSHADASSIRGESGQDLGWAKFHVRSDTLSYRAQYVWPTTLAGAGVESAMVLPFPAIDLQRQIAPALPDASGSRTGLADPLVIPARLAWKGETVNQSAVLEIIVPLGAYDVGAKVNTGRNYWQFAPAYALTWRPRPEAALAAKLRYGFNTTNGATQYASGDELTLEYSAGWRFTPAVTLGIQGYFFRQTTDDRLNGEPTSAANGKLVGTGIGNRGSVNAVGPFLGWRFSPQFALTAKLQQDYDVKNRPDFTRFWLQALLPF
jgi:hypothetical protein